MQAKLHIFRVLAAGWMVLIFLLSSQSRLPERGHFGAKLYERIMDPTRKLILITGHRRENFGQAFIDLCSAIRDLANAHPDWDFLCPVHLNPNVRKPVYDILAGFDNIYADRTGRLRAVRVADGPFGHDTY